jgi:hypothetical protein
MQPPPETPTHLRPLLDALRFMEDRFHAASRAASPEDFERIVAPDFWEIGASGRRYSRAFCLQVLTERAAQPAEDAWITRDWHLRELGADHCLLTYTLEQPGRVSLRATLWRCAGEGWQAVFHQGTIVLP